MTDFVEGEKVIMFYFNYSTGRPNEKQVIVDDVGQTEYILKEAFGPKEFVFDRQTDDVYVKEDGVDNRHFGKDASLSDSFNK